MSLAHSKDVTKKVLSHVSLKRNGIIANMGLLVEHFILGHGPASPASGSAFWTWHIVVTIAGVVAVTIPAIPRTSRPGPWPSFLPPGRTLEHRGPGRAQTVGLKCLCELWPQDLDSFGLLDGLSGA